MKLASSNDCTACMACVDSCNHDALSVSLDKNGFFKIDQHLDKCIECGLCSKICPILNPIEIDRYDYSLSSPFATWSCDKDLRTRAASGGAFAALAKKVIELGGVVYGASIENFNIKHFRVDKLEDLQIILGSKYQHSSMIGIYRCIKKDLNNGKIVLFGGLSCQVAGLKNYISSKLQVNLYTIDTICGGVSTMLPMLYIKESDRYKSIVSYRDKSKGWRSKGFQYALKLERIDGVIEDLGMDNLFIKCFCHKETKRVSCLDCKFNGYHRISDCTIGDFWGDEQFRDQHKNGLSVIVTHDNRIKKLIETSSLVVNPITWQHMVAKNPSMYWSKYPYLKKSLFRYLLFFFLRRNNEKAVNFLFKHNSIFQRINIKLYHNSIEKDKATIFSMITNI